LSESVRFCVSSSLHAGMKEAAEGRKGGVSCVVRQAIGQYLAMCNLQSAEGTK
jgi:predicted transcriptional regulator